MFNKTIVVTRRRQTVYHNQTVHEHRAPTDESVKVLKEYHEKALQWASDAVFEKLDPINASVAQFEMSPVDLKYYLCLNINGRKVLIKIDKPYERAQALSEAVCKHIAAELTAQLFEMKAL